MGCLCGVSATRVGGLPVWCVGDEDVTALLLMPPPLLRSDLPSRSFWIFCGTGGGVMYVKPAEGAWVRKGDVIGERSRGMASLMVSIPASPVFPAPCLIPGAKNVQLNCSISSVFSSIGLSPPV